MENKYIIQWKNLMNEAVEALGQQNYPEYEKLMMQVNNAYENFRNDASLRYECVNFGMSNYIFEDALPELFVKKPELIKNFVSLIKEDSNLSNQFQFYKALDNYNGKSDAKEYVNESLKILKENINVKTLNKSNNKLKVFIVEHDLKPMEHISNDDLKLFESCDYLFKSPRKLSNLNQVNENIEVLVDYISNKSKNITESKEKVASLLEKVNSSDTLLNEEERSLVYDIMDHKAHDANAKREKLYNKFKNECVTTINKLLEKASNDDKEGLLAIKEQLLNQQYCEETIVTDIAKLLEIRDVLLSE